MLFLCLAAWLREPSVKAIPSFSASEQLVDTVDTIKETVEAIIEKKAPRYLVEFKAFKTGEWYPKTRTDYINSAYSVASCNNHGRAYRITYTWARRNSSKEESSKHL